MRLLAYIDLHDDADQDYVDFLNEELPKRLKLLEADYGGIPWTVTFADDEYGDDSLESFATTVRQNHDNYDAIIVIPQSTRVEEDLRLQNGHTTHSYFRKLSEIVANCGDVPLIGYVDEPGPKVEFNLLSIGFSQVVDQTNEPALLPLKVARAVNSASGADAESVLQIGPAEIDLKTGETTVNGAKVHFTPHERATLLYLARSRGKVRSKEQLLKNMYGLDGDEPEIKIIDVFMTKVRTKLNGATPGLGYDLLRTSWGDGYMMLKDMPTGRLHRGLLRLDPLEEGGYAVPDTQLNITDAQFQVFEHLHGALGRGVPAQDNFLLSNGDALDSLRHVFSNYFVSRGDAIEHDEETGRIGLNPTYFDTGVTDASDFNTLMRQQIKAIGNYVFLRVNNSHMYTLKNTDLSFNTAEIRMLEQLMHLEGQAVRAHTLYKQVRGDASARYDRTPDEDMIELAKTLYTKLQKAGLDDADRNIHIYHSAYLSFGPAEEVPDPESIQAERRERMAAAHTDMLAQAGGKKVKLERFDAGYFTLLVHPVLGKGIIEGKGVELRADHVSLIKAVHAAREDGKPGIISHRQLFEKIWPTRSFTQQKIGTETYQLRTLLSGIDRNWGAALTLVHGQGFAAVMAGEEAPGGIPEVIEKNINWRDCDVGYFTIKINPDEGTGFIDGKKQRLSPTQVNILTALHAWTHNHKDVPKIMPEAELYKFAYGPDAHYAPHRLTAAVGGLRQLLEFHSADWANALVTKRGRGYVWLAEGQALPEIVAAAEPEPEYQENDLGHFKLLLNPLDGTSRIHGKTQSLNPAHTAILLALHAAREKQGNAPQPVPETDLFRAVYEDREFTPGSLSLTVNSLRQILKFHDEAWSNALVTERGRGFGFVRSGETFAPPAANLVQYDRKDIGLFTLMIDPDNGSSYIDGTNQWLNATHTKILRTLYEEREKQGDKPQPVSELDLHRLAFVDESYEPGELSSEVNKLRRKLTAQNEKWAEALVTKRMRGFAWLRDNDVLEEDAAEAKSARPAKVETPPTEIELVGGLVLLRDESTGKALVQDTELVLNANEAKLLQILSDSYPENVYTADLSRQLKVMNIRQLADNFKKHWDMYCSDVMMPFAINFAGTALSWDIGPAAKNADAVGGKPFEIGALSGVYARCANTGVDFAPREAEIISYLQNRVDQTVSLVSVGTVSKVKWDAKIALATLESALGKVRKVNPALADRFEISARQGNVRLKPALRRLPAPANQGDAPPILAVG